MKNKHMVGDTGLLLGTYYLLGGRRMMLMNDHELKGIWLTDPTLPVATTREADALKSWYGSRAEFDAAGWIAE